VIRGVRLCLGIILLTFAVFAEDRAQDAGAIYLEGLRLASGEGCQIDMLRARELYRKAADLGDPRALAWKARSIYRGSRGFSKDEAEARRILQEIEPQLREMGLNKQPDALGSLCRTLATIDPKGRGQEAFELAKKNAIDGKPSDWDTMGWLFYDGVGVTKDEKEAVKWYTKAAEQGEAVGQRLLGWCYANGAGIAKDEKEAVKWYAKSSEQGDADGQRLLGWCYANGNGVPKDEKEAVKWYTKAAEQGEAVGQRLHGWCCENGTGVPKDEKEAVKWNTKAAEQGDADGQRLLGWCYENGKGVAKDEKEALRWYLKAAEGKQAWSMGQLARMYEEGRGTDKNPTEAFRWWNRQAEAGDFWAPENVARCHANGIGTPKNPEEAAKWYGKVRAKLEEETKKNEAWPWDNLGRFYFNGLGAEKDYAKALECYHKAADLKSGWSMEQIGWCYENGKGVAKDEKEAVKWYLKAAEKKQAWSMGALSRMYENGRGLEKDQKKAFEYCLKSAEAGDFWSQNRVGWYFANGNGVEKDYKKALKWYRKAADKENSDAIGNVGWCYETGNGVAKDENEALKWYVQAAKKQNRWAEKRFMAMGDAAYWDKNYSLAAKCFEAAEKFGIKGAGEGLYRLDVQSKKMWEGADPKRGILAKRKAVKGQDSENSETARLAGELLSFGYPIEAGKMVQEAIENARWGTADEELAEWFTLAGFCCIADPQADPDRLISGNPNLGSKWLRPEFAQVGLGMFNLKIESPQLGLDVSYLSDFISPSEPRRWASLLMAQLEWGLKLWQEQSTGWYSRLARASVASNSKGIDYLWATQNLQNLGKAKENFEKATKLFSNFSAWAGLAMIARQEGDTLGQEKAIEEMKNILTENAIVDTAKLPKIAKGKAGEKKLEDIAKEIAEKGKARRNKMFERLTKNGQLPWGNEKGELTFGFGYGSGSGLFHGGLLTIGGQLFIPLFLTVKPDWLMLAYDMCMSSGNLSPYQLTPLYEQLTKRSSTRIRAVSRLVQIHRYLDNKEETLRWALLAAEENPQDLVTLQTAASVAQWAGESEKAHAFSVKIVKAEERDRSKTDDSPQNKYLQIYAKIQEADRHLQSREMGKAQHLYENALDGLEEIEKRYPDWEPSIIRYRIKYLEEKLSEIDQVEQKK